MVAEKKKPKKKIPKFKEIKKPIIIGAIIAGFAITGIIVGIIILGGYDTDKPPKILTFGYPGLPFTLDPLEVAYPIDINMLYQVAEGLFDIDENGNIISGLAYINNRTWSQDALNLTCNLRKGVKFHDGTLFNASAVKWNFDRIYYFLNNSLLEYPDLWIFPDGTPIVNDTQVIDDYTVKFVLNKAFVPFESLLATYSSFIISPTSTQEDRFLNLGNDNITGTGAFIFEHFEPSKNISMLANPIYWNGKPKIDKLILIELNTTDFTTGAPLLSGDVDLMFRHFGWEEEVLETFRNNSSFIVEAGPFSNLRYLVMNNELINKTMRKAISYALNYSFIETLGGIRAKSPIPESILYYNTTGINVPFYDVSIARQTLKDVNWNNTAGALTADNNISAGNEWEKLVDNGTPLAIYNYTYVKNSPIFPPLNFITLLIENLKQIGIKVEPYNISITKYSAQRFETGGYHRNMFELCWGWWAADYNDPSTFINPLFTNETVAFNTGQVNDHLTQMWMTEALSETDPIARKDLYYDIQKHLIEEVYPIAFSYSTVLAAIYDSNINGWSTNSWNWPFKNVCFDL
ncbi:MAG: ABC transporter substrate-binding protein [Promethearchaeota archaeon]